MQRPPESYQTGTDLLQSRGLFATDVLRNVETVTANRIHRNLTPPTIHGQTQIQQKFGEFVELLKNQGKTEFDEYNLPHAFDVGATLLPLSVLIAFMNYICLSSQGSIQQRITVVTLQNKIGLFLGLTTRLTGNSYGPQITRQLYAYADSTACQDFNLSRDVRIKPVADQVDVSRVLVQLWQPTHPTKSTRMRHQIGFCIKKASASGSRPGQDVESSAAGYRNSNEALEYRDTQFTIVPANSVVPLEPGDDPDVDTRAISRPRMCVRLRARLQKGKRDNKKVAMDLVFLPQDLSGSEPFTGAGYCIVTDLVMMVMHDRALKHVPNLDVLHTLMKNATTVTTLQIKAEWLNVPILRTYSDSQKGEISANKALKYSTLYSQYEKLGVLAGFQDKFGPYCLRRMAANEMDEAARVSSVQRTKTMGHNQFSKIFQSSYIKNLVQVDLSAVASGREEDRASIKAVGRMSMNADMNAPIAVSPEGLQKILDNAEVKVAQEALDKAHLDHMRAVKAGFATVNEELQIRNRTVFHEERSLWFQNADERLLASTTMVIEPVTILPEKDEEQDLINLDMSARISKFGDINFNNLSPAQLEMFVHEGGYTHAMQAQAEVLQQSIAETLSSIEPEIPVAAPDVRSIRLRGEFTHSVIPLHPVYDPSKHFPFDLTKKLFHGGFSDDGTLLSQINIWKVHGYQDEQLTPAGNCPGPGCDKDLSAKSFTSSLRSIHLHQCCREIQQELSDAELHKQYPDIPMAKCPLIIIKKGLIVASDSVMKRFASREELQGHIEEQHGIPSLQHGFLQFCYWCHEWIMNPVEYNAHRENHFIADWEPHRLALESGKPTPLEKCPKYALNVNTGLVRNPGICPFCAWDPDLRLSCAHAWLHQETASNLETHIMKHHHVPLARQHEAGILLACPCKMCLQSQHTTFTLKDLYNHLITVHNIPLQGCLAKKKGTGEFHPIQRLKDLKRPNNVGEDWILYGSDGSDWAEELTPPASPSAPVPHDLPALLSDSPSDFRDPGDNQKALNNGKPDLADIHTLNAISGGVSTSAMGAVARSSSLAAALPAAPIECFARE
ncbi:hypothetical protein B0H13DRAFT_2303824 [Mycena leptocephala]|nr:hypothetical protein B0H13DRAFT_2303824 [Mycena leptocephala]